MLEHRRRYGLALLFGLGVATAAAPANAQDCSALALPNPIYGAGGSAITATLSRVAAYLAGLDPPITVFWNDPGACTGYQQYLNDSITGTAVKYWDTSRTLHTCNASGQPADFAHMGNPHEFCVGLTLPAGYPDGFETWVSAAQTLNIIVDKDSSQTSISAEALYHLFALGAGAEGHAVEPWTNPAHVVVRPPSAFAHQLPAVAATNNSALQAFDDPGADGAGVPGTGNGRLGFRCRDQGCVINQVATFGEASPETPIGYVSGSAADTSDARTKIKTLAYQSYDQECGYWPDSSASTLDKVNVRRGKYELWTPGHFYARVDEGGGFVNPNVETLVELMTETENSDVLREIILAGDIPLCAMQVTRDGLLGAMSSYAPEDPCSCFFEVVATGRSDACEACNDDEDCSESGAKCRRNYCEAY
jgi:ABC-type phosphate transport system substrate-binding protein